jgi:hypothetical protein
MEKYYLTNYDITENCYFKSNAEAFAEAQKRNRYDRNANWIAWDQYGEAIYSIVSIK